MKTRLENRVIELVKSTQYYENENNVISKELNELTPGYQTLCKVFEETCQDYESVKKALIEVKAKKTELELTIKSLKNKTIEHSKSRVI